MRFFLIFCLSLLVLNTYSQNFTFADSLRGNLTSLRTCYDVFYYDLNLTVDDKNKQLVNSYNDFHIISTDDMAVSDNLDAGSIDVGQISITSDGINIGNDLKFIISRHT